MIAFFLTSLWLGLACFYIATVIVTAVRFRRPPAAAASAPPPCSIVLPIKGNSEYLESNLRALARLKPFQGEILLAVAREDDPAAAVIRRVIAEGPSYVKMLVGEDDSFTNPKLRNVAKAYFAAREEIVLFLDDSVALDPALFAELVGGFHSDVVAVTAAPDGEDAGSFFAMIEAASCNGYLFRIQMFLNLFGLPAAFGNAFAFRKQDLESVGGLARLQNGPCEDSAIATALRETGKRLSLLHSGVRRRIGDRNWNDIYLRHLRWASCTKVHDPVVFFVEPLIGGFVFNVLGAYVLSNGLGVSGAASLLWCMAFWYGAEAFLHLVCGWSLHATSLLSWIARDLLQPVFMLCARFTREVKWRGETIQMR